jgi:ADP-ribosylglycohydrolase
MSAVLDRAQGCLLGQLAGDSLGSLVEFRGPAEIRGLYPSGVRDLEDGGHWNLRAGQPTDDSELALALARSIAGHGGYSAAKAREAYKKWVASGPFDIGQATRRALGEDDPDGQSQANGSLMRISPLGIYAWNRRDGSELARLDSAITHPNPVCADSCAAFVAAVACGVAGGGPAEAYAKARETARVPDVREALDRAKDGPPGDFMNHRGWVLVALRNAFFRLLHAPSLEEGVIETVHGGGDTDTNAAIAGALLGAVHGRAAVPSRWTRAILECRPAAGPGVVHPRPPEYWPADALAIAERLVSFA